LDRIAADKGQNSATRLTCLLALYHAGNSLRTDSVLPILAIEKKLERRIVAIRLLGYCRDVKKARTQLVELLDDPNVYVRSAALYALEDAGPDASALPKLKALLDDADPREDVRSILGLIGKIGNTKARDALAGVLTECLEAQAESRRLDAAISAFEEATSRRW